jgi:hypothetical protein
MNRSKEPFFFERPKAAERSSLGDRLLPNSRSRWFGEKPRVGLVISTYGAAPYVELALAVRRKLYGDVPVLVHDDASPEQNALMELCDRYGATFQTNSSRLGHEMGDLSSIVGGLHWARSSGVELLVKMSRRFTPVVNWAQDLQTLAAVTQYATFARECLSCKVPLRTECIAMAVEPWSAPEILDEMADYMLRNRISIWVEGYVFSYAQRAYELNCLVAQQWELDHIRVTPRPPYINWPFLSESRRTKSPNYLWHETAMPEDYLRLAKAVDLPLNLHALTRYSSQSGI